MKKRHLLLCLLFSLAFLLLVSCGAETPTTTDTAPSSDSTEAPATSTAETTEAPVTSTSLFVFEGEFSASMPKPSPAEKIYSIGVPAEEYNHLTLVSLQGILAKNSKERLLVNYDKSTAAYLSAIKKHYSDSCSTSTSGGVWSFLNSRADILSGYILTDMGDESINVATSLAGILNAIIVTEENEINAKNLSLSCLADVRDKDDAWLRQSEYFDRLNRDIAFMLTPTGVEFLRDYAIFCGAYMFSDADKTSAGLLTHISHLNPGFVVLGWNNNLGELSTVQTISGKSGCMIPADWAKNIATLAGFPLVCAQQKTDIDYSDNVNKHTVCLVMSDGDNLQWVLNDFLTSNKWFGSRQRGKFPFAWGLPASMIDLATPAFLHYYNSMKENEEYIMQLSGLGYTFPSKWRDMTALAQMQKKVTDAMARSDMSVMEILDDVKLTSAVVKKYYGGFLDADAVDGILYIDYGNYDAYHGQIFWYEGKPVVSARYRLWADLQGSDINSIANAINQASTDPKSADAYSFIIVHAWSGLNPADQLVNNGNTMDAVAELVEAFGDNVELVTPSEFIARISENLRK